MGVFQNSVFFGVLVSLASYGIGMAVKRKTGWSLANPLLISIILVICVLLLTGVSYTTYSAGANSISYLLTPATICLAVPLYQQVELLKKNYHAVLLGIMPPTSHSCLSLSRPPLVSVCRKNWVVTSLFPSWSLSLRVCWAISLRRNSWHCFVSRNRLPKVSPSAVLLMPWVRRRRWRWVPSREL